MGADPYFHTQAHDGDILRTEKEALDFWIQTWHSYALAPTPAVQAACAEDSASQVGCPGRLCREG